ncbi:MAG TPA: hypothetical protein VGL89_05975 [Candidatus Koribacter sp.]
MHEHLFPRKDMINILTSMDAIESEQLRKQLERFNIGVVITIGEHKQLSPSGTHDDPWERYRAVGVVWSDLSESGTRP